MASGLNGEVFYWGLLFFSPMTRKAAGNVTKLKKYAKLLLVRIRTNNLIMIINKPLALLGEARSFSLK